MSVVMQDDKLKALREAWLDVPFCGVTSKGNDWLQPLINAVTAIVDPDETLRATPEARRRGHLASFRSRHAWAAHQVELATKHGIAAEIERWAAERDACARECREALDVEL